MSISLSLLTLTLPVTTSSYLGIAFIFAFVAWQSFKIRSYSSGFKEGMAITIWWIS